MAVIPEFLLFRYFMLIDATALLFISARKKYGSDKMPFCLNQTLFSSGM